MESFFLTERPHAAPVLHTIRQVLVLVLGLPKIWDNVWYSPLDSQSIQLALLCTRSP